MEIINDIICESEVEQFTSNLTLVTGVLVIVDPPSAKVIIFDNRSDCVCK